MWRKKDTVYLDQGASWAGDKEPQGVSRKSRERDRKTSERQQYVKGQSTRGASGRKRVFVYSTQHYDDPILLQPLDGVAWEPWCSFNIWESGMNVSFVWLNITYWQVMYWPTSEHNIIMSIETHFTLYYTVYNDVKWFAMLRSIGKSKAIPIVISMLILTLFVHAQKRFHLSSPTEEVSN